MLALLCSDPKCKDASAITGRLYNFTSQSDGRFAMPHRARSLLDNAIVIGRGNHVTSRSLCLLHHIYSKKCRYVAKLLGVRVINKENITNTSSYLQNIQNTHS